jgi:hypothetical protein
MIGTAPCKVRGETRGLDFVLPATRRARKTHHDETNDTGGARALDDRIRAFTEVVRVQVAVCVRKSKHDAAASVARAL